MQDIWFFLGAKVIKTKVDKIGFFRRGIGLMFSSRDTNNLLFEFSGSERVAITSVFVFYPFLAVWLDHHNRVLDFHYVKPFTLSVRPKVACKKLIEIPFNAKNKEILSVFRRKIGKI